MAALFTKSTHQLSASCAKHAWRRDLSPIVARRIDPMNAQPNLGMQVTTFENPMGINGFEFVEFAAPAGRAHELHALFQRMGFSAVLKHKSRPITVYRQNGVNLLVNEDPDSFAADFAAQHGPSACGFAIRFNKPVAEVEAAVLANGGEAITHK